MMLIDHKFDTVLTDIEVVSVFCLHAEYVNISLIHALLKNDGK